MAATRSVGFRPRLRTLARFAGNDNDNGSGDGNGNDTGDDKGDDHGKANDYGNAPLHRQ